MPSAVKCLILLIVQSVIISGALIAGDSSLDSLAQIRITFRVSTPSNANTGIIYISGNDSLLGYWAPDQVPLQKLPNSFWEISLRFSRGRHIEYKFTRGSWKTEALGPNGGIPDNHILKVDSDTVIYHHILAWKNMTMVNQTVSVAGDVRYHRNLIYPGLRPRDLIVWLPPGYETDKDRRYPVLYMHDGQNIIDSETAAFGQEWQVDETADSLISSGLMEPIIVVGIYNTSDRSKEYAPGDFGTRYMRFVTDSVKKLIDQNYRTLPGPEYTGTGGSSQGGLIAFMLVWEYPAIFSKAACISPAFRFKGVDYIATVKNTGRPEKDLQIYLDLGTVGLDSILTPQLNGIINALRDKGFRSEKQIFMYIDRNAEHSEKFWARRFWRPLMIFWGADDE